MSEFAESEASEASSLSSASLSDAEMPTIRRKKTKNKKHKRIAQSSDEESSASDDDEIPNEEEICRKEGEGWLVDEDEDEKEEVSVKSNDGHKSSEEEEDLDEEDFDLIQENVGVNLKRKKKRRLLLEDDDNEIEHKRNRDDVDKGREKIARQIFENDDDEESDGEPQARRPIEKPDTSTFHVQDDEEEDEERDEDNMDDFIVDDIPGESRARQKNQRKTFIHKDAALQEAQDIFGVDFDFAEFEKLEDGMGEAAAEEYEESEDEYDSEMDDEDVAERAAIRRASKLPKEVLERKVKELFDPCDLERAFFTQADEKIRKTDIPERFQLRRVPVKLLEEIPTAEELAELSEEAEWIFEHAFNQDTDKKCLAAKSAVYQVLKILREGHEVPFIAFYRKESFTPDLSVPELWKIYDFDEKWSELQRSKKSLIKVLQRLIDFFEWKSSNGFETSRIDASQEKTNVIRLVAQIRGAISSDEINDLRLYYLLHFSKFTDDVVKWETKQKKKKNKEGGTEGQNGQTGEGEEEDEEEEEPGAKVGDEAEINRERRALERSLITLTLDPQTGRMIKQRRQRTNAAYELASRANICELVKRFGLSAVQFAQNVSDQYMRHDVDQCPMLPLDAAKDFECPQFPTIDSALRAARYMLAFEIAREPNVRKMARHTLKTQTVVNVKATKKGLVDIDETHPLYPVKFLADKPIAELLDKPLFLHLHNAEKDGLLTIELKQYEVRGCTLFDEFRRYFTQDEFSSLVQAWNDQRDMVLREALDVFLLPQLFQEIRKMLLHSSEQAVLKTCSAKIADWLQQAPYSVSMDDKDMDASGRRSKHREPVVSGCGPAKAARVMSICLKEADQNLSPQLTAVMLDCNGEVVDFCHAPGLLVPERSQREDLKAQRASDLQMLTSFMARVSPQVIVIGCDNRRALRVREQMQQLCDQMHTDRKLGRVNVELADAESAQVSAQSPRSMSEFPNNYTQLMRMAISLGRRFQDPLAELAQLMNYDQDILALRVHPLQDSIAKETLWKVFEIEFVNKVNEVGVDVNRCLDHAHTANMLQFVSGFGPRKATYMLKTMKHQKLRLSKRMELVTEFKLGPKIVMNCAGFVRIDTMQVHDLDDVEILDSTRVHLESYDLAKKMAIDALEYDDTEDNDPNQALEEIIRMPDKLRELDLDAFAEELKNKGHGDKAITLYDIRAELNQRYKDTRTPYQSPNNEQIFSMATGETPETLHRGKLVECRVNNMVLRRPRQEQLDSANPQKSNETGLWICPFCRKNDFQQLNFVWNHYDNNECPGEPIGLQVIMENGINGFVPIKFTDLTVEEMIEKYPEGSMLQARVTKIDIQRFNVELTCKQVDLKDERNMYRVQKDSYYDYEAENNQLAELKAEEEKAAAKAQRTPYTSRVIFHPNFRNINFEQTCMLEPTMQPGDVIIRPSSKGSDHLTLSWKVDKGIMTHVDILEKEKSAPFALGKKLLIGQEEYDDLDEVIARYVQPMSSYLNELLNYKSYRDSRGGKKDVLAEMLRKDKEAQPERIPYFISASKDHPGYFLLAYMPNQTPHFEYMSITVDGYKFRRMIFPTLDRLLQWFKENYNDPTYKQAQAARGVQQARKDPPISASPGGSARLPGGERPVRGTPSGRTPMGGRINNTSTSPLKYRDDEKVFNSPDAGYLMPPSHNRTPNAYAYPPRNSRQTAA